jgi:hypothetical protein
VLIGKAIAANPKDPTAHCSMGNVQMFEGEHEAAAASFRKALRLQPALPEALNNLGNALRATGQLDEADASYRRALALRPDDGDTRYHHAMLMLARGDMPAGWEAHEWRWQARAVNWPRRDFPQPRWRGEPAAGRTLLITSEQGFGDVLQFCRYAPLVAATGLRVILEAPKPLVRLMQSLAGVEQVVALGEPLPDFDLQCPMMSLPLAMGTTMQTIPGEVPYLSPDAAQVTAWRSRLSALDGRALCVGLVWEGGVDKESPSDRAVGRRRSMAPALLAPLFEIPNVQFISLQKDGTRAPVDFPLTDFMDEIADFADTAALVRNLDLVISVDTSVAHLAGALGKPVWLMDRFIPCWRWLTGRRDSPWYPTMWICRQPSPDDWASVVREVARDLRSLVQPAWFVTPRITRRRFRPEGEHSPPTASAGRGRRR